MKTIFISVACWGVCLFGTAQVAHVSNNGEKVYYGSVTVGQDSTLFQKDIKKSSNVGGRFELSAGIGTPEFIYFKVKYGRRFRAGMSLGILPNGWNFDRDGSTSLGIDFYQYFAKSKKTDQFSWYVNGGISKLFPGSTYPNMFQEVTENIIIFTRFGRSIYFSKSAGINLDLGFELAQKRVTRWGSPMYTAAYGHRVMFNDDTFWEPLPSISLSFFVKF
jgi:hypothetical protein